MIISARFYVKNSFTYHLIQIQIGDYQSPFIHFLEHFRNEGNLHETISDLELVIVNLIKQL